MENLESVHYNLVQKFKVTDWLFQTKPDFEILRAFLFSKNNT